jgi:hypothetical protein
MTYKLDINESFLKDFKQIEELLNTLENKIAGIKQFVKEAEETIREKQNEKIHQGTN